MKMTHILITALSLTVASTGIAVAAQHTAAPATAASVTTAMSEGEVRRVNKETGKVTLKHGPLDNLGMPPMTMVFQTRDPALLEGLKVGDKVRFTAEKNGSAYTVTRIETMQQ